MSDRADGSPLGIVCIGASAGGLHALLPLLRGLNAGGGLAYVIAQHQSPTQDNLLPEILGKACRLPVMAVTDGLALAADRVYVAPPGKDVEVTADRVVLCERRPGSLIAPSIDRLFHSCAEAFGVDARAVILSGAGSDGTAGARAIKQAGGRVLVQLPEEALQPSMLRSAIAAGCADRVGSIGSILSWLETDPQSFTAELMEHVPSLAETYCTLFALVSTVTGIDLSRYKEATLHRQTRRRYLSLGLNSLSQYVAYVQQHAEEPLRLQQYFMISVSSFFRDHAAFAALEQALRESIGAKRPGDSIRIWVPGCATGEEVYSLAMLVAEILSDKADHFVVRVIGSDIDEAALDYARAGVYTAAEISSLDQDRRERWLKREGDDWKVAQKLREMCVFALHDVTANPPFIKLDVVSCRNLLIYLTSNQQNELIQNFAYALNRGGLLMLGKSESVGIRNPGFEAIDGALKIFRRRAVSAEAVLRLSRSNWPKHGSHSPMSHPTGNPSRDDLVAAAREAMAHFAPPGVLLNGRFEPLHFFGPSQRYFSLPQGEVDFAAFSLCLPELASELKAMCYRMAQEKPAKLEGLAVDVRCGDQIVRVRPSMGRIELNEDNGELGFLLILQEVPSRAPDPEPGTEAAAMNGRDALRLQQELADTREHLHHVIENLEASNEELQSMQEELQASAEELQASNEELQASNEELTTLNEELRQKSHESMQLNVTLSNVQNSVRMSLVLLDRAGHVLRFNDLATRIFGLVKSDVGQLIYGIPCQLALPDLRRRVADVVARGESHLEEVGRDEFHYLMRIDPYRDEDSTITGAVLTFSDISELHRLEQARQTSEIRFGKVWDASMEGLLVSNSEGVILLANPAAEEMFGYGKGEMQGLTIEALVPESLRTGHVGKRQHFIGQGDQARKMAERTDLKGQRKDGSAFAIAVSLSSFDLDGQRVALASVADVTEARRHRLALQQNEARLRSFVETLPVATAMFDRDMRYLAASRRWQEDYNLGDRDLTGLSHYEVFPEIGEEWKAVHRRALAGEAVRAEEDRFLRADGTIQWLHWEVMPWRSVEGEIGGILIVAEDITARKEAAEQARNRAALEQELSILQNVLDTGMAGYWDWNLPKGTKYLSATFKHMLGYGKDDIPDTESAWRTLIFADDLRDLDTLLARHVASKGTVPFHREVRYRHRNGPTVWVICSGLVVEWAADGKPLRMVGAHIDVTNMHRQLDALEAASRQAEAASRAKSTFLANMSHEIRTPLNAVIGLSHILAGRLTDVEHRDMVGKIGTAGSHLLGVINDILDLSSIEAERFELHPKAFDLAEIGDRLQVMLADRAKAKGLEFSVTCPSLGYAVRGDETRYLQAALNIAVNAVKYTTAGYVRVRIGRVKETEDRVLLRAEVEDSGPGISTDAQQHLFERFERGAAQSEIGGTGLGLNIVKRLAGLMGGEAGVCSEPGEGSTFWFTVWLEKCAATPAAPSPTDQDALERLRQAHGGARVLLAEDDAVNQEIAKLLLEEAGLVVDIADDGAQAVAKARDNADYRLVFMDMQMPVMDGLEATREIRRLPGWSKKPIIAMTANAFSEDRVRCEVAGMSDFVSKPVDPEALYETTLHWLNANLMN